MRFLLDTNICIYMIKNNPPEVRRRFQGIAPGDVSISSVTIAELQYGVEKSAAKEKNALALAAFLRNFKEYPICNAKLGCSKKRQRPCLASDKKDKFFVTGVDSSVHDRSKKRRLTQYHAKQGRCQDAI